METIHQLEREFELLLKKSKSLFLSLVGVEGKIKGLEIILKISDNSSLSKKDIQKINVKLVEYFLRYKSLPIVVKSQIDPDNDFFLPLKYISYSFGDENTYFIIPIELNDGFIITVQSQEINKILKQVHTISHLLLQMKEERSG